MKDLKLPEKWQIDFEKREMWKKGFLGSNNNENVLFFLNNDSIEIIFHDNDDFLELKECLEKSKIEFVIEIKVESSYY